MLSLSRAIFRIFSTCMVKLGFSCLVVSSVIQAVESLRGLMTEKQRDEKTHNDCRLKSASIFLFLLWRHCQATSPVSPINTYQLTKTYRRKNCVVFNRPSSQNSATEPGKPCKNWLIFCFCRAHWLLRLSICQLFASKTYIIRNSKHARTSYPSNGFWAMISFKNQNAKFKTFYYFMCALRLVQRK